MGRRLAKKNGLLKSPAALQDGATAYACVAALVRKACAASGDAGLMDTLDTLQVGMASQPEYWRRMQAEVTRPLAELLTARAGGAGAHQLQRAVEEARALATRKCAHLRCVTVAGPSEAALPRFQVCSGCLLVRYCGASCQKADWRAHRAACRELQRRAAAPEEEEELEVGVTAPPV